MHPCSRPGCLLPLPTSLSLSLSLCAHTIYHRRAKSWREKRRRMKKKHARSKEGGGAKDRRRKVASLFSRALVFSPLSRSTEIKRLLPGRPTPSKDPRVCTHTQRVTRTRTHTSTSRLALYPRDHACADTQQGRESLSADTCGLTCYARCSHLLQRPGWGEKGEREREKKSSLALFSAFHTGRTKHPSPMSTRLVFCPSSPGLLLLSGCLSSYRCTLGVLSSLSLSLEPRASFPTPVFLGWESRSGR